MKLTKKQRDAQEREYAAEIEALDEKIAREDAERDAVNRAALAKRQRTHGDRFQDSYGDPVIHAPDYE